LDIEKIVAELKLERDKISRAIEALDGASTTRTTSKAIASLLSIPAVETGKRKVHTAESRKRLSIAMKKRWAERKKKGL
jgi:hypothetical protein